MAANAPDPDVLESLIGFGRDLRGRGLPVGTGRIVTFCRAAGALGVVVRDDLYWAGRSSLISRPEVRDGVPPPAADPRLAAGGRWCG